MPEAIAAPTPSTAPAPATDTGTAHARREIFAIAGLAPEVLAVAMAKYSRSPNSIRQTIEELTEEKSAEFHEKWVLGYGDASVADMAMVAIALENVSILASKVIEDNRIASYQEKSTRYQPFDSTRYYRPAAIAASPHAATYTATVEHLFATYGELIERLQTYYRDHYPRPTEITEKLYESKTRARALDIARYLLPAGTLTNFGMIMSARALRHAIAKLLGHPHREMQEIGRELQTAAVAPAYNPQTQAMQPLFDRLADHDVEDVRTTAREILAHLRLQVKGAPTLVKHTEAKPYLSEKQAVMCEVVTRIGLAPAPRGTYAADPRVELIDPHEPEDELVATLCYDATNRPYREVLHRVQQLTAGEKADIIATVQAHRGPYDWPSREFEVGNRFIFDTLMDYGAFRDLQRHRICTQVNQELSVDHGTEIPRDLEAAGGLPQFREAIDRAVTCHDLLARDVGVEAQYVIPLAFRKRTLFKMNLRELHHIVELRSKAGGHFSYRALVTEMHAQVRRRYPVLAAHIRCAPVDFDADFFKR